MVEHYIELHSALALVLGILAGLLVRAFLTRGPPSLSPPPCIRGWIPWLGAALQMGKAPLEFIEEARQKHGPIFTVMATGTRLTFVSGDEGVSAFFKSKQVNFLQAVQKPVQHTASLGEETFYQLHEDIIKMMTFRLSYNRLNEYTSRLSGEITLRLDQLSSQGTTELYSLVRQVMYPAVVDTLFGKGVCPTTKDTIKEFEEHFRTFDEGFEYGSQLPEWLFKNWSMSKQWLLKLFKNIIPKAEESKPSEGDSKTLLHHLLDILKGNSTNNYSLLLLWASQANANPITFWTLAFIISEPEVYKKVMSQITSAFGNGGEHHLSITAADLKKVPFVKSCALEAIRLRPPGVITRKVVKPLKVYNYVVPPGDMLMLSPYWIHRDPKYFPDPETFKPERWSEETVEKNVFLPGFIAFGGGKYQCPGRWFALMEIQMLVILVLYKYEFQLLDPLPKQSNLHLLGTQQPDGPCRVKFKLRE